MVHFRVTPVFSAIIQAAMEAIFNPDNLSYVSQKIHVSNWTADIQNELKDWSTAVATNDANQKIADLLDINVARVSELETACSLEQLTCKWEEYLPKFDEQTTSLHSPSKIPKDVIPMLNTLAMQERMLQAVFTNSAKTMSYRQIDLKRQAPVPFPRQQVEGEIVSNFANLSKVVFVVRIHAPTKPEHNSRLIPPRSQEMLVLGSQTLDRLRDQIYCPNDMALVGEVSENPQERSTTVAKELVRSGMFYIEGTLYSDFRDAVNADYGEVIARWAAEDPKRRVGPFDRKAMETITFRELTLRLGHPYLYLHLGECEHLITITDIRLKNVEDIEDPNLYPLIKDTLENDFRYCMACRLHGAKWVTEDNERTPHSVMLYCDACFTKFNYQKGSKVGNFKAYHYVQPTPDDPFVDCRDPVTIP